MTEEIKPKSKERAAVFIKAAMEALDQAGGSLALREVKAEVAKRIPLTPHELSIYEKTGYVRWESNLHFYSIGCAKAGYIKKHGGRWHLTPEGRAMMTLEGRDILDRADKAYRQWKATQSIGTQPVAAVVETALEPTVEQAERSFVFEQAEAAARTEIETYVKGRGPYEFQELVAALLRGMGYATPFVAPAGPDGGTDILAYPDPLGARTPHIRVQVKHRQAKATREEIAALRGMIRQDREIGLFVSTYGFTSEAEREARQGTVHIELINLDRFLEQWITFYDRMSEEDKGLLRLRRVFFLAPE
jgi:restriction system protein